MTRNHLYAFALAALLLCSGAEALAGSQSRDYRQAVKLYRSGMYESARDMFEALGSEGDVLSEGYGALCAAKMRTEGYKQTLEAYLARYPESSLASQIHYQLGLDAFDEGDYATSRDEFALFSTDDLFKEQVAEYVFKRAYSDYGLGDYDRARSRFLTLEKMPQSDYTAPARYAVGYIDYSHSEFGSAIDWFTLSAVDPRFTAQAEYYILECRFNNKDYRYVVDHGPAMYDTIPEERQQHLSRILSESYLVLGDVDRAKEYYDLNLASSEARTRSDHFYAGSMLYAIKDWSGAIGSFKEMGALTDSLGQIASYQMADAYLQSKNKVAAMDAFAQAATLSYDAEIQEDAMFNYAKLAFDLNQDGQPFTDYIARYAKSRSGDEIYSYMALAKLSQRDYAGAVEAYDNIDDLSPDMRSNYMKANYLRAVQLISAGSWKDAAPCLQAAAFYTGRRNPFNQLSRYWLAESYFNSGKSAQAAEVFTDLYNTSALDGSAESEALPYNIAHAYFRDGDYAAAAKWFDTYRDNGGKAFLKDALVRRADCDFLRKDYKSATLSYEAVLQSFGDPDDVYPYYQLGLAYGLSGSKAADRQNKIDALSRVRGASPSAAFWPEAMYELGRAYVDAGKDAQARECFEALRDSSKDATYVARALIDLGMLERNAKHLDKALDYYKQVVETLPKSEYTQDALLAIESIYQSKGEPEAYIAYTESLGDGPRKTEAEKEQIFFNSAEQVFLSGNYQKAVTSLQKYLEAYPGGEHVTETCFYLAESYAALGQKENAVDSYARVIKSADAGTMLEPAALKYASLSYELEHYADAYGGYTVLKQYARMEENLLAAQTGLMRSAYRAKNFSAAIDAAVALKADPKCGADLAREADYIRAKSLMSSSRRAEAMTAFKALASDPSTSEGAEAAYLLIQSTYDEGNFASVEKMVYDFAAGAGGQNYWLAKSFVVLGDAFAEQDNLAQAKATFESIASGYEAYGPEDDVPETVAMRLEKLNSLMN